ncbi:MAG: PLDc_N domain-containing protein [Candidatus Omnitrophica bacterium]|nr:PLDc_N domain-containing protein [Candidatus Omnitrophota bacterium]
MGALISIAILVLDIVAIVDAVKSSMDNVKKALWIAAIIVLPIIGMVVYFLVAKKKA